MTKHHVFISDKALHQRIRRKLRWSGRALKAARGGGYLLLDLDRDFVVRHYASLEDCGRDLGVLQPFELLSAGASQDMRRMRDSGMSLSAIGQRYGVTKQRIHQILKQSEDGKA